MLSKDYQTVNVYSTNYLISHQNICFVAADGGKNAQMFVHAPQSEYFKITKSNKNSR